jgi:hypothetical protein
VKHFFTSDANELAYVDRPRQAIYIPDDEGCLEGAGLGILDPVFVLDLSQNSWKKLERKLAKFDNNLLFDFNNNNNKN